MPTQDIGVEPRTGRIEVDHTRPYSPSWIDRFTAWVDRLPGPSWLCYLVMWLTLLLLYSAVKWWDRAYPIGMLNAIHLLLTGTGVYVIALIHYLDRSAGAALAAFRPVLTVDAQRYAELHYRLTTLPPRPTWWVALLVGLWRGTYFFFHPDLFPPLNLGTSQLALSIEIVLFCFIWAMAGVFVYHTFHQLQLVSRIYSHDTHINLFHLGPLYAFSHLTARTALGILLLGMIWVISERLTGFPLLLNETTLFFSFVALLTFLWPLRSAHTSLTAEKQRLQDDTAQRLANTFAELDHRVDANALGDIGTLKTAIDSLQMKQTAIAKISTWPWQIDTFRAVVTAIALPLVIWVIQRVLELFVFAN